MYKLVTGGAPCSLMWWRKTWEPTIYIIMWGWGVKTYCCVILGLVHSSLCHIIAYVCIGKYIICIYIYTEHDIYVYICIYICVYIYIYQNILNSTEVLLQDWPRKIARKKVQESRVETLPNRVPMGVQHDKTINMGSEAQGRQHPMGCPMGDWEVVQPTHGLDMLTLDLPNIFCLFIKPINIH